MAIFIIENVGAIETGLLPSGDMKVWHHFNERLRSIVEGICRGRGYWNPEYNNWIVKGRFIEAVIFELTAQSTRIV